MISARARSRYPAPPLTPLGLATAGAAAAALVLAAPLLPFGDLIQLAPSARALLLASAAMVALTTALAPHRIPRRELCEAGLAGLGGQALLMAATDPLAVAVLLLLIGFGFATRPSPRPFVARARAPAFAATLIGVGWMLVHMPGPAWAARSGALSLAFGLAAAAGLVPYLAARGAEEPASSSPVVWMGFFGPALAISLPARVLGGMPAADAAVFGAALVGLGLVNLGWGTIGAWRTESDAEAWRCSFVADWGLALVGGGLFVRDGLAASYLALLGIVLVRVPLYLWARPLLLGAPASQSREPASLGVPGLLLAVILAGAAPFSGFPVRLLVLSAATQIAWPLAVPLIAAMLLGTASAMRLARTVGSHPGRAAAGLWLTVGLALLLGLAPGALRAVGGV